MHYPFSRFVRIAALRLLPLALFAVSAQAAAIFNITGAVCNSVAGNTSTATAVSGDTLVTNALPLSGGVQGAVLNGACTDLISDELDFTLEAVMNGNFLGSDMPLPATVPVEFDFTVSSDGGIEIFDWYVELFINDVNYFSRSGSSLMNPGNPVGGGPTATLPAGILGAGDTWQAVAGVNCRFCFGTLTVDLGNSSLRINPASSTVPEPSTVSLLALGGFLLWFKRRRA